MFTLKGCFDGDGGLVGFGGSVGSWPNARLRRESDTFSYLILSLGSAFYDGKLRFVCGFLYIAFHDYLPILKQFD